MPPAPITLPALSDAILTRRALLEPSRALLVGISGIDGSGKGWVTRRLADRLRQAERRVVTLNADGWLNLPGVRFGEEAPGQHFYHHALRLDRFVADLLLPLQAWREVDLVADHAEETARAFRPQRYAFTDVDIVLAEGIFLFKAPYRRVFDLRIWIACSFETALERAMARAQEGLPPEETAQVYRRTYFPAQELHLQLDDPEGHADFVVLNDPRPGSWRMRPAAPGSRPAQNQSRKPVVG